MTTLNTTKQSTARQTVNSSKITADNLYQIAAVFKKKHIKKHSIIYPNQQISVKRITRNRDFFISELLINNLHDSITVGYCNAYLSRLIGDELSRNKANVSEAQRSNYVICEIDSDSFDGSIVYGKVSISYVANMSQMLKKI